MEVYAIPNYECTLACPHCEIKDMKCKWDKDKFLSALHTLPQNAHVTLFGGEPTMFSDRLEACWKTGKVNSISTNLMHLNQTAWKVLFDRNISIATSWNFTRFNVNLPMCRWLSNLEALAGIGRKCMIMVTLTEDLISDKNWLEVLRAFDQIDRTNACDKLLFEHLVADDADQAFYDACDSWLCRIHWTWKWKFKNELEEKLKKGWKFACNDTWTLHPDGNMTFGCPHGKKKAFCMKCLKCKHKAECKPCSLQKFCTRPNQLAQKLGIDLQVSGK